MPTAHDLADIKINTDATSLRDQHGRTLLLRGVNVSGTSKLPTAPPNASSPSHAEFLQHRDVSFIGRPFGLDAAEEHLGRLRAWGLTLVRLCVTWEALEHAGPGIYDEDYIEYLIAFIGVMEKFGIKCLIDPHQDTWSRFSGGSGAPGWTLEIAGFDLQNLVSTGAAVLYDTMQRTTEDETAMVWPTNYTKLACATMFTLFFGGTIFAPLETVDGIPIQEFLQERYIACFEHLAKRIRHLPAVIGVELMNEPSPGYIGRTDLDAGWDANKDLIFGLCPSPLDAFALGDGCTRTIGFWVRHWPHPTRLSEHREVNSERLRAWTVNKECIWRRHHVWGVDSATGEPAILQPSYFTTNPGTGEPVDFYRDCYSPFARRYAERVVRAVSPAWMFFLGPLPNEPPPAMIEDTGNDIPGMVYAPHWYDLECVFSKRFNGVYTTDVPLLSRGGNILKAIYFGAAGARKNYTIQISRLVKHARTNFSTLGIPCIIGECGIPMDINSRHALLTGDFTHHRTFLDSVIYAMEQNLVGFTLWNYNPDNCHDHGDSWNGEDFSIFSQSQKLNGAGNQSSEFELTASVAPTAVRTDTERPTLADLDKQRLGKLPGSIVSTVMDHLDPLTRLDDGGRVLDVLLRPYAVKIAGTPTQSQFEWRDRRFVLCFRVKQTSSAGLGDADVLSRTTEIYVPGYHYGGGDIQVKASSGQWTYQASCQTLIHVHDGAPADIWIAIQAASTRQCSIM